MRPTRRDGKGGLTWEFRAVEPGFTIGIAHAPVVDHGCEIYQYVGDETVVSWPEEIVQGRNAGQGVGGRNRTGRGAGRDERLAIVETAPLGQFS